MRRSQLETKYLKTETQTDLKLHKKYKNFCSTLYKRERRKYSEPLDMKNVLDSKEFWKTMRPFLFDRNTVFSQISIEKNKWLNLIIWICLKSLAPSLKMLSGHSMSSQMNIMRNQERNIEVQKKCIEEFVWGASLFWLHVLLSMWFSVVFFVFSCPLPKWRVCWMGPILRWLVFCVMIQWVIGRRSPYFPLFLRPCEMGRKSYYDVVTGTIL